MPIWRTKTKRKLSQSLVLKLASDSKIVAASVLRGSESLGDFLVLHLWPVTGMSCSIAKTT